MVVTRTVVPNSGDDDPGVAGWLWVRRDPPLFPGNEYDVLVSYAPADDGWSAARLDGRHDAIGSLQSELGDVAGRVTALLEQSLAVEDESSHRDSSVVSAVFGAAAATVFLPFLQVIVSKSAEDAYARLSRIFTREEPQQPRQVAIVDEQSGATLIAPDPLPTNAVRQLVAIPPEDLRAYIHRWDETDMTWHRYERAEPPHAP
ncbi:hypothetical protein ACFQ0G_51140 [Streptomyces chiangmaiensis]